MLLKLFALACWIEFVTASRESKLLAYRIDVDEDDEDDEDPKKIIGKKRIIEKVIFFFWELSNRIFYALNIPDIASFLGWNSSKKLDHLKY